ncbi:MAG: hypothetical protein AAFO87_17585 [Cyanobacteria bacterium J06607_6]
MNLELRLLDMTEFTPSGTVVDTVTGFPTLAAAPYQGTAPVLAQQFDQDVVGDLGNALNTFVQSGQIWALLVGFVLGYLLRGVTTYK